VHAETAQLKTRALHDTCVKLLGLGAQVFVLLEFKRASATADLQLRAVFTFWFGVLSFSYAHCQGMVPDILPRVLEDVAQTFKVALAWVDVTVWTNTHVH